MPLYELAMILRKMPITETATALKRLSTKIYDTNAVFYGIQNLGMRKLPFIQTRHSMKNTEASFFVLKFDAPPDALSFIIDEFKRDLDVVRSGVKNIGETDKFECTLEGELQPPAYREDVKLLLAEGKRKERKKFEFKSGLDYNPF